MQRADRRGGSWHLLLRYMRFPLCAFVVLAGLAMVGILLLRATLLQNAYETGTALSRSYAAEERGNLNVYETLLTFGTTALNGRMEDGETKEEISDFLETYFYRVNTVLGNGVVDPYVVLDGEILAANPWEGDVNYDFAGTTWYQQAIAAEGAVIFTPVYIDVIYGRPVVTAAQSCRDGKSVMAFDILPEHLRFETVDLSKGDSFFLCDGAGTIIYQETDLELSRNELQDYLTNLVEQIQSGALESQPVIRDLEGQRRGVYYTRMDNGWYSIVTVPYSNILGSLQGITWALFLIFAVSFLTVTALARREQQLEIRARRANETAQVLGNTYYALYRVDYGQETYEMIKGSDYVRSRISATGPYVDLIRTAGEVIEPDAFQDFAESFSCENIRELVSQRVRDFGGEFLRRFGEEERWVSVRVLFDEALAPEEVVLSFQEVEREKQRQLQERRLLEESLYLARQNEESKQAFFRNMSHDMRTPLNAILGSSELARRHLEDPVKTAEYLDKIDGSGRYLLGLINDILEMARMEHGQVQLEHRQFDLKLCVEECLVTFRLQAERENKILREQFQAGHTLLLGDAFRIQQILNNLLSNAFKFTPEHGTISLLVQQLDGGDFAKYKFVISDTGIGMSPAFLERIFEPYAREMRFSDRQASGTGLGMSITKSLISQMGGEIQVESAPGAGSTFTVVLPLAIAEVRQTQVTEEPAEQQTPFSLEGLHLLLAEDNAINMEIATELLKEQGAAVTQAWNGLEAVARFQEAEPFTFDAVLMDMQMPELDGCEAARQIRELNRPDAGTTPIIAVTANAFAEDVAATAAAGMNAHISKPIDFVMLRQMLERLLRP